jgi:hypothetical protein
MTTYYTLPYEIILLIAHTSPLAWYKLACADSRVGRLSIQEKDKIDIQNYFTRKEINDLLTIYTLCGKIHRNNDKPALILSNSRMCWYQHGKLHRDKRPAQIDFIRCFNTVNGELCEIVIVKQEWYKNGVRHRSRGLPAIVHTSGSLEWYKRGLWCHNENPINSIKFHNNWWENGKRIK